MIKSSVSFSLLFCVAVSIHTERGALHAASSGLGHTVATSLFRPAEQSVAQFEERSRRKWGNALIADLDQDGYLDLVLTEHAQHARIYWNDAGSFTSKPVVIARGDTHGVAAGDYDQDGRMDVVIIPGGGGGKKPSYPKAIHVSRDRTIEKSAEFEGFMNTRGRAGKLIDADQDGSLDFVTTAFEGSDKGGDINFMYDNVGDGRFELFGALPRAKRMGNRTLVTDYNGDGDFDLILYGGHDIVVAQGQAGLGFKDVSGSVLKSLKDISNVSSISEIDYDNDGDFDLFITRARDAFGELTYFDEDTCCFAFFSRTQEMDFDDLTIDGDFTFENLQMAYPDFDVFVGAEKRLLTFDEWPDQHGHKDFVLKPSEAQGWPADLSDPGLYIGHLGDSVWRVGGKTLSPTAGVIHNVRSHPKASVLKEMPAYLLENRDGTFVDVTDTMGISIDEQTTSAAVGDYNNDGWSDIFVVRHGNSAMQTEQILYLNQGGQSFERMENHGIISKELGATGGGAEAFDYDRDGDLDIIFCNERGRWHLFTNHSVADDSSNYVVVNVGASPSKKAPANGATVTISAGGQTYKRVVGASSAAHDHSMNTYLHVGLGAVDTIDAMQVRWSNGETEIVEATSVNGTINVGN